MHRDDLRERIEAGAYLVDPGVVAEAMLARLSAVFVTPQPLDGDAFGVKKLDAEALADPA